MQILSGLCFAAVNQEYETDVGKEYVIVGNNGLMKCDVPSFVADLVRVASWEDSSGRVYSPTNQNYGTNK